MATSSSELSAVDIHRKIRQLSEDKYTVDFVQSALRNSSALKNIECEVNNLLTFFAWFIRVKYFQVIQAAVQNNTPLKYCVFESAQDLLDEHPILEDAIDQILEEFEKFTDDGDYQSDTKSTEVVQYNHWKDAFDAAFIELIENAIDTILIGPSTSVILAYTASLHDANLSPSEAQLHFTREDKSLKAALAECNSRNESKRKAKFLRAELHSIIHQVIAAGDINNSALKIAIKYGYPLPLSAAKTITIVIDNFLIKSGIYQAGVCLEMNDQSKRVLLHFASKQGKVETTMRPFNGVLFLCQTDYHAYVGMADQTVDDVDNAFFYEALVGFLKFLSSKFPRQAETLREGILNEL